MKSLVYIFITSFVLNFVWEHLHSVLYTSYKGGPVTDFILLRAAFGDAVIITGFVALILYIPVLKNREWFIIPLGLIVAIAIEVFALNTGRWVYSSAMPLIPLLNVGLSPTVELAATGFLALWLVRRG